MATIQEKVSLFRSLHIPGRPLILYNVWDVGSAKAVAESGAKALGTSSWAVAAANGFLDGENVPLDFVLANLRRIAGATSLPVTIDLERGYGEETRTVGECVTSALTAGAIGLNLEDSLPNGLLRNPSEQARRFREARSAADRIGLQAFINARTDIFFGHQPEEHDDHMLQNALSRAHMYAEAGADGLFVPGLISASLIARLVKGSPLPVNIMATDKSSSITELARLGVARISCGPAPYLLAMKALREAAKAFSA